VEEVDRDPMLTLRIASDTKPNVLLKQFMNDVDRKINIRMTPNNKNISLWEHTSLTKKADILKVTKGSSIGCGHCYTDYYETLLSKWYNKTVSILEIGLSRYGINSTPSLDLWKIYMGKTANIYGYDKNPSFLKFNKPNEKMCIFIGNQQIKEDILQCCKFNYDVIIDDGAHDSKGQQTMFKTIWNSINSGGIYCFESLHWQPSNDFGKKTRELLLEWKNGNVIGSEFISNDEATEIHKDILKIDFYCSKSKIWAEDVKQHAFCVVHKK